MDDQSRDRAHLKKRGSGILLHVTSLSSPYGIGDMGPGAVAFVDFLHETKQSYWQILPLNPTDPCMANSPYQSASAFAGNPVLISPEHLLRDGSLRPEDLGDVSEFPSERVDYPSACEFKKRLLEIAWKRFRSQRQNSDYDRFCLEHGGWLEDFALFMSLKSRFQGKGWDRWPEALRDRHPDALVEARKELSESIEREKFFQYLFYSQWQDLKRYANDKGIRIIGDVPIYVVFDSVDVWTNPDLFKLDEQKKPFAVAGVPPDYFSETGQLWGNPVYRWDRIKERGYDWWIARLAHNLRLYDLVRIDHFRGFLAYWEIPAEEETAVRGRWVEGPGADLFHRLMEAFQDPPIIAEDLGTITPDVWELMETFHLPGMKVLLFAFGPDLPTNPYAPHNHVRNCIVYTGTHDNNTARGWFRKELTDEDRVRLCRYVGGDLTEENIAWELIRLAMMSVADTVIFPMQDILGLDERARMNRPATQDGNWEWRLDPHLVTSQRRQRLREMTEIYGRVSEDTH
jgi:4-alpha-glucanotransferase